MLLSSLGRERNGHAGDTLVRWGPGGPGVTLLSKPHCDPARCSLSAGVEGWGGSLQAQRSVRLPALALEENTVRSFSVAGSPRLYHSIIPTFSPLP